MMEQGQYIHEVVERVLTARRLLNEISPVTMPPDVRSHLYSMEEHLRLALKDATAAMADLYEKAAR